MSYSCFDVDVTDKVARITLSRGDELNTMTPAFWTELPQIVDGLSNGGEVRAIVLASTGRHFTAGMDLSVFTGGNGAVSGGGAPTSRTARQASTRLLALKLQDSFTALERSRVPVLAAVQGGCIGGGVDMVTACDMRYATADAFFCIQEINIGMTADVGTLQRLPKLIPEGVARQFAYTGERFSAQRAFELGLVNEVFDTHDDLLAGVTEIATEIASKAPMAMWGSKQMLNYTRDHSVADGLDYIATWQMGMFSPEEMGEAFTANAEKRRGNYNDIPPMPDDL